MLFLPNHLSEGVEAAQVTSQVQLVFNVPDHWFAIVDANGEQYETPGAVAMDTSDIDALVVALGDLRKRIEPATASG